MADMKIYQEVELSLTESLIPTTVHVKQFDHLARRIKCTLYSHSLEYTIPDGAIVSCSGTRPDGNIFQYSSESTDCVFVEDNAIVFTITDFMTAVFGRYPVDVALLSADGDVLGMFSLILRVDRAAVGNGKIAAITFSKAVEAVGAGIYEVFVTEDGHFGIRTNDGLGFHDGSVSSTLEKVRASILNSSITDNGHIAFTTETGLGLVFGTDEEGRLVVEFGIE